LLPAPLLARVRAFAEREFSAGVVLGPGGKGLDGGRNRVFPSLTASAPYWPVDNNNTNNNISSKFGSAAPAAAFGVSALVFGDVTAHGAARAHGRWNWLRQTRIVLSSSSSSTSLSKNPSSSSSSAAAWLLAHEEDTVVVDDGLLPALAPPSASSRSTIGSSSSTNKINTSSSKSASGGGQSASALSPSLSSVAAAPASGGGIAVQLFGASWGASSSVSPLPFWPVPIWINFRLALNQD
jgi:hypothetical protein